MSPNNEMTEIPETEFDIVSTDLPADLETPVSAYLKLRGIGAGFLFESAEGVDRLGRYSFIGFASGRSLQAGRGQTVYTDGTREYVAMGDPLEVVKTVLARSRIAGSRGAPALLGAAAGFVSYDYARFLEDIPTRPGKVADTPVCRFGFVESLVVFDHLMRKMTVFSLTPLGLKAGLDLHNRILGALEAPLGSRPAADRGAEVRFDSGTSATEYAELVRKAKRYIRDGDCFQIVLSRRLRAECAPDHFDIYRRLRMSNPSPYMFYIDFGGHKLIGSSPEMLVKLTGRRAFISPIAGTRPRGGDAAEDSALEAGLLSDEKERAEHVMLVDLARNDLGRMCRCGSVKVGGYMRVERYSHVMHIVSDVTGDLRDRCDQFDLFRAAFPAGTVSGAPKVRAMQIIEELEKDARGVYAGAVGYFSPSGDMDTCIAIRTIFVEGGTVFIQAGAGIVADSDPDREFAETENKLAAVRCAVESAAGGVR
ncbi:MAG: anthranilate synthase component I family protein [Planctomycetota bacterium]|nr:anthranilate synthase component I family protein [Planctomycetota bacterium]